MIANLKFLFSGKATCCLFFQIIEVEGRGERGGKVKSSSSPQEETLAN